LTFELILKKNLFRRRTGTYMPNRFCFLSNIFIYLFI